MNPHFFDVFQFQTKGLVFSKNGFIRLVIMCLLDRFFIYLQYYANTYVIMGIAKPSSSSFFDIKNYDTIFISYAREDYGSAKKLYDGLKNAGLKPWLDTENILPGQNWDEEIQKAVTNSKFFLPLFSNNSIKKGRYVQREFKLGMKTAKEIPKGQIFIIPAKLEVCEIPYKKIRSIQYVDLFPSWDIGLKKIFQTTRMMGKWGEYGEILITKIQRANEVIDQSKKYMKNVEEMMDIIFSSDVPSIIAHLDVYRDGYKNIINRDAKIRLITDITKKNINFCKEIKEWITELRYLKGIECGLAVSKNRYMAAFPYFKYSNSEYHLMQDVLYSDKGDITTHNQRIFNTFWANALSSEERFKEIEDELKRDIEITDKNLINNPNNSNDYRDKALALNGLGKYENALEFIDIALGLNTNSSEIFDTKGEILLNLKKYSEASECFKKSLGIDANNIDAMNHMTLVSLIIYQFA